jgi:hypothetical protein
MQPQTVASEEHPHKKKQEQGGDAEAVARFADNDT